MRAETSRRLPCDARALASLRFRLRHEADEGGARARIAWTNSAGEPLGEEKSLRVPLSRAAGEWQDYVVQLGELRLWTDSARGGPLQQLTLEFTEARGALWLGPLEFS